MTPILGIVIYGNDLPASGGLRRQVLLLQNSNGFLREGDDEISVSSCGKHGPVDSKQSRNGMLHDSFNRVVTYFRIYSVLPLPLPSYASMLSKVCEGTKDDSPQSTPINFIV